KAGLPCEPGSPPPSPLLPLYLAKTTTASPGVRAAQASSSPIDCDAGQCTPALVPLLCFRLISPAPAPGS
uniref:Uncharacterized protein n=1 Tax=Aegilops tauschii subsp. strangulata TaxID=200361 RepID=A0A453Q066_AEGTS